MKEFRRINGRIMACPGHLKQNMLMIYPNSWVSNQIRVKYCASTHYPHGEGDPLNIGTERNDSIIISLCTFFIL